MQLAPCLQFRNTVPAATTAARRASTRAVCAARGAVTVVAAAGRPVQQQQQQQDAPPQTLPRASAPADVPQSDFWEGEQFDLLGKVASLFIPILVVAAVGVGVFASQTYMEGATVFLDSPKGPEDTVRLIPAQELQP